MTVEVKYKGTFDGRDVVAEARKIQRALRDSGRAGTRTFDRTGASAVKMGAAVGASAGVVLELTRRFIDLGAGAAQALQGIVKEAIDMNLSFEQAERIFSNVFNDPELGKQTVQFLRNAADELRISQQEAITFGQRILPRTDSLETFNEILRLTAIQSKATGQSVIDLEFAVREALTGDYVSLRDRFDLSRETIAQIKELSGEIGESAALAQVLGEEFERLGKGVISDTGQAALGTLNTELTNLQALLGEPAAEQFKNTINAILEAFQNNREEIRTAAVAIGDMAAAAIDFVGSGIVGFIEGIDLEGVEAFADHMITAFNTAGLLLDILDAPEAFNSLISGANDLLETLNKVAFAASRAAAEVTAEIARTEAENEVLGVDPIGLGLGRNAVARFFADDETAAKAAAAGQEAYEASLRKSAEAVAEFTERQKESAEASENRADRANKETEVDESAIAAKLALDAATKELAKTQAEATETEEALTAAREKSSAEALERAARFQAEQAQEQTEHELRQSEARIAAAADEARQRESIIFRHNQRVEALSIADKLTEISRKNAQQRIDIGRNLRDELVRVEEDYQRRLRDIQTQFERSAVEAAIAVDAQALARAQRTRDDAVEDAERTRGDQVGSAKDNAEKQRQELKEALQREIADAKEAHKQKLADMEDRLQQELEAFDFNAQQQRERQAERDALEDERLRRRQEENLAKFERGELDKQKRLEDSLAKQVAALDAAKKQEIELVARAEKAKADIQIKEAERVAATLPLIEKESRTDSVLGALPLIARRRGGSVQARQPYLVGEGGPELFVPASNGSVISNSNMFSPAAMGSVLGGGGSSTTINNIEAGFSRSDMDDPERVSMLRSLIRQEFAGILRR